MQALEADIREIRFQLNELAGRRGISTRDVPDFTPVPVTLPPSAVNQLRNGDLSHSVRTWNSGAAGNQDYECAYFFTHDTPVAAQQLDESTSFADLNIDADATPATNKALKSSAHANYNAAYCDWDRSTGVGRLQGTKSLDAPFGDLYAKPNVGVIALGLRAALRDARMVVPVGFRIGAGIWDNTAGQRDYINSASSFTLTGAVRGTPAATTSRKYKVFLYTDRGYTFLSNEITVAAPTDASYSSTCDVYLSWDLIPGVLEAHIYRYDVATTTYRLLDKTSGNTYADNGTYQAVAIAGYPPATDTRAKAYVATLDGELSTLAIDGVDASWDSIFLNIPIPTGYNSGNTTDKQWLRITQNMALDRRVTDAVVNNGSPTLTSATAVFSALDTGRSATVTDAAGHTLPVTLTYVNATTVTMSANWTNANATGCTLYIVAGGDLGLLVDLVHTSYTPGSVYAPNPEDKRALNPAATPNGSTQGGVGPGGGGESGGGGIACVTEDTPIMVFEGERIVARAYRDVAVGAALFGGGVARNLVQKKRPGAAHILVLRTANGIELECSPSHRLVTTRADSSGRRADTLAPGDSIVTYRQGRIEVSSVKTITETGRVERVGTFSLAPGHLYAAGRAYPRNWLERALFRLRRAPVAGILSHNIKRSEGGDLN
jgi:hypothetical protein